jgi:hypothetical protein
MILPAITSIIARQRALAEFGLFALRSSDINDVLQEACKQVARGLDVPIAKLAVLQESGDLLLRGAVGLAEFAVVGETILPGGTKSALGYGLLARAPVVSVVDEERRFDPSDLVRRSGVKVSANVVIWIDGQPFAGLEADSKTDWNVTPTRSRFPSVVCKSCRWRDREG